MKLQLTVDNEIEIDFHKIARFILFILLFSITGCCFIALSVNAVSLKICLSLIYLSSWIYISTYSDCVCVNIKRTTFIWIMLWGLILQSFYVSSQGKYEIDKNALRHWYEALLQVVFWGAVNVFDHLKIFSVLQAKYVKFASIIKCKSC